MTYATEEVERLTKVLDEQTGLLQASQEQAAQNETTIQTLQDKVPCKERNYSFVLMLRLNTAWNSFAEPSQLSILTDEFSSSALSPVETAGRLGRTNHQK